MRTHGLMNSRAGKGALLLALPAMAADAAVTESSAEFDSRAARAAVTNTFFPLAPGTVYTYRANTGKKTVVKVGPSEGRTALQGHGRARERRGRGDPGQGARLLRVQRSP